MSEQPLWTEKNHKPGEPTSERQILAREQALRAWLTRDADPLLAQIDGLDIGWGGVQRWATARMPPPTAGPHLDLACGYATFLAQLGWRYPTARLLGLNIDFDGPHALARPLLARAGVSVPLLQADARRLPFADGSLGSVSCFLGLQDVEIGFGPQGVRATVTEAVRVLRPSGVLSLWDEFPFQRYDTLLDELPVTVIDRGERELDVRWDRPVAERALPLYAAGWVAQARPVDPAAEARLYAATHARMAAEMERQLADRGYFVPFGPVRMVLVRKEDGNMIEQAHPDDVPAILALINASNRAAFRDIIPQPHFREPVLDLEELLDDFQRMTFYVYRSKGSIVGVAALYVESPDAGKIRWVYVLRGHQGRGIGTALVTHIERQARELGLNRLWLVTVEKASWAVSLYQKLGYALRERIERPWGFNVRMEKEL
jgi:N-acetylglutamate synthase-like GNAT family acetyltransferase/SAM-dependent methyltransferase